MPFWVKLFIKFTLAYFILFQTFAYCYEKPIMTEYLDRDAETFHVDWVPIVDRKKNVAAIVNKIVNGQNNSDTSSKEKINRIGHMLNISYDIEAKDVQDGKLYFSQIQSKKESDYISEDRSRLSSGGARNLNIYLFSILGSILSIIYSHLMF